MLQTLQTTQTKVRSIFVVFSVSDFLLTHKLLNTTYSKQTRRLSYQRQLKTGDNLGGDLYNLYTKYLKLCMTLYKTSENRK